MEAILTDADDALPVSLAVRNSSDILALGKMFARMASVSPCKDGDKLLWRESQASHYWDPYFA